MEVRQLNTLIRAAQFQSFSKAAESLGPRALPCGTSRRRKPPL